MTEKDRCIEAIKRLAEKHKTDSVKEILAKVEAKEEVEEEVEESD